MSSVDSLSVQRFSDLNGETQMVARVTSMSPTQTRTVTVDNTPRGSVVLNAPAVSITNEDVDDDTYTDRMRYDSIEIRGTIDNTKI